MLKEISLSRRALLKTCSTTTDLPNDEVYMCVCVCVCVRERERERRGEGRGREREKAEDMTIL